MGPDWLETTFRQACTADKTGGVAFLDVNHCVTFEDDFGFVTKDFVKPTAKEKQLIDGKPCPDDVALRPTTRATSST